MDNNHLTDEDIIAHWSIPETEYHQKSRKWFIYASGLFALLLVYSFYTSNFFFAIILIIVAVIVIIKDSQEVNMIDVYITHHGLQLGRKFYDFEHIKNFSIIYKPEQGKKHIFFELHDSFHPGIHFPLNDTNPLLVREGLLKYVDENLERNDIPTSEAINRIIKL